MTRALLTLFLGVALAVAGAWALVTGTAGERYANTPVNWTPDTFGHWPKDRQLEWVSEEHPVPEVWNSRPAVYWPLQAGGAFVVVAGTLLLFRGLRLVAPANGRRS